MSPRAACGVNHSADTCCAWCVCAGSERWWLVQQSVRVHVVRVLARHVWQHCRPLTDSPLRVNAARYHGMPHEEPTARRIYAKSTKDTASGVAALAAASRVWAPYSYQVSRRYLLAAQRGWQFLVAHPSPEPSGGWQTPGFCDTSGFMGGEIDVGVRMWAAAELMRATGNQTYRDYFEEYVCRRLFLGSVCCGLTVHRLLAGPTIPSSTSRAGSPSQGCTPRSLLTCWTQQHLRPHAARTSPPGCWLPCRSMRRPRLATRTFGMRVCRTLHPAH